MSTAQSVPVTAADSAAFALANSGNINKVLTEAGVADQYLQQAGTLLTDNLHGGQAIAPALQTTLDSVAAQIQHSETQTVPVEAAEQVSETLATGKSLNPDQQVLFENLQNGASPAEAQTAAEQAQAVQQLLIEAQTVPVTPENQQYNELSRPPSGR